MKDEVRLSTNYRRKIQRSALVLEDLTMDDQGNYVCKITSAVGTIEYRTRLDVAGMFYTEATRNLPVTFRLDSLNLIIENI